MKVNIVIHHKAITVRYENHVNTNMVLELVQIFPLHSCSCSFQLQLSVASCSCQLPVSSCANLDIRTQAGWCYKFYWYALVYKLYHKGVSRICTLGKRKFVQAVTKGS
jgi:hypothetical protein